MLLFSILSGICQFLVFKLPLFQNSNRLGVISSSILSSVLYILVIGFSDLKTILHIIVLGLAILTGSIQVIVLGLIILRKNIRINISDIMSSITNV